MHRRTDLFGPDVHIFRPERWTESQPNPWEYLPFNGGPRICIGQIFALVEIQYTLIRIFQEFETVKLMQEKVQLEGGGDQFET